VDTAGGNIKAIEAYIRNQWKEDKGYEQLAMSEVVNLFAGEQYGASKERCFRGSW